MTASHLRNARLANGWSQSAAAAHLGITQPYYYLLERGYRPLPPDLAHLAVTVCNASPLVLPLPALTPQLSSPRPRELAAQLAALGYPGFAHLPKAPEQINPALLVAAALSNSDLESRIVEALPWVLARFHELDWSWLTSQCRLDNHQNRLAYLILLAIDLAHPAVPAALPTALCDLECSRLAVEGTLCRESMLATERAWVRSRRPPEAAHWNLLTTLTVDQLTHAA